MILIIFLISLKAGQTPKKTYQINTIYWYNLSIDSEYIERPLFAE